MPQRPRPPLALVLGVLLIVLAVLALQAALGLVFDPRYRDFPFAPLTGGAFPFLLLMCGVTAASAEPDARAVGRQPRLPRRRCSVFPPLYIVFNESLANWQALWFCAGLVALAVTLLRARDAPG